MIDFDLGNWRRWFKSFGRHCVYRKEIKIMRISSLHFLNSYMLGEQNLPKSMDVTYPLAIRARDPFKSKQLF